MKIFVENDVAYVSFSKKLEKMGIGVKKGGKLILHPIEVLYLVLNGRGEVVGKSLVDVFEWCMERIDNFIPKYCVYEDLRRRGYKVKILEDVLVGKYVFYPIEEIEDVSIRSLAERRFENLVLAVVDEENELTYYKVKEVEPRGRHEEEEFNVKGVLVENRIFTDGFLHRTYFYGSMKGDMTILSILEGAYLVEKGCLEVYKAGSKLKLDELIDVGRRKDPDFERRFEVYRDLKDRGFVVKTGLKFGSDFRLYEYVGERLPHSTYLVTIVDDRTIPAFEIVRAVRLAHSVRKKMLFVYKDEKGNRYISIERVKV
ncbi:tRNA-intron lyase [Archaeoglobus profundus]|uniref:tRNA intron endonuclease n=1 Tax=Archaeoglobus profundus (strain DSM 5631 / JCM 9629 / NBRC 100127 / Av18) TaxID=572546 RepID=D2REQ8_ARCPA|nr:tRNA-intron lyase [Archaeoglobus profundus]ADB58602.1 tRNA intron endonuclease [Archaeoglobus profundus DSM 5631]